MRGVAGSTPGHGSRARYQIGCRCESCSRAAARGLKVYRLQIARGEVLTSDGCGVQRRLRALAALGWPSHEIGRLLGVSHSRVRQYQNDPLPHVFTTTLVRVREVYDRLSMTPGPSKVTRTRAERAGWVPPLAWDDADLDDPAARPRVDAREEIAWVPWAHGVVRPDEVAIQRAITGTGEPPVLTTVERRLAVIALSAAGASDIDIATRCGVTSMTVLRDRKAMRVESRWSA